MRYIALIYGDPAGYTTMTPEAVEQEMNDYWAYDQAAREAGVFLGGEALQDPGTATTVRVREAERVVTDGPFAETKEVLGGYYLLECKDLDEALDWAARIPGARTGSVEVRPVMEFEAPGAEQDAAAGAGAGG